MKTVYLCENEKNVRDVFGYGGRVYTKADVMTSPELFSDTEYLFSTWGMPSFTEEEIRSTLPSLKALFYGAGSVQAFGRQFLNCGVRVFSSWAANAVPVAEYTVAQIVLANKGYHGSSRLAKSGNRAMAREYSEAFVGNYGAKIGIIGAGMIGSLVIKMLKAYDLDVIVHDPFLSDSRAEELGVKKVSLEELFCSSNVVSSHLANNESTKGMLGGKLFGTMQPYSTFINTGRGAQVVERELVSVLKDRPDLTAVLDVTYPEPPEEGSELYTLPNCVLTPHIAGSAGNEVRRMGLYMMKEYDALINGLPCRYEVTVKMLETMA